MGLDMYLNRMPRHKGATAEDVSGVESFLGWLQAKFDGSKYAKCGFKEWCGCEKMPSQEDLEFYADYYKATYSMVLQARPEMYKVVNVRIHRVVAEVFLGPCPDEYVVNHKDGNKKNNCVDNLEYVTPSENNQHALDTGLRNPWSGKNARKGVDNHFATISEDVVYEILRIRDQTGYGCRRIGKMLNLSRSVVNHILSGHSWKETVEKYYKDKGENKNA